MVQPSNEVGRFATVESQKTRRPRRKSKVDPAGLKEKGPLTEKTTQTGSVTGRRKWVVVRTVAFVREASDVCPVL